MTLPIRKKGRTHFIEARSRECGNERTSEICVCFIFSSWIGFLMMN